LISAQTKSELEGVTQAELNALNGGAAGGAAIVGGIPPTALMPKS
jgi:hypothetical protein